MFVVQGYIDRVSYAVEVGPREGERELVRGNPRALALLDVLQGQPVLVTPVGPELIVDLTDARSVLAALTVNTQVTSVDGDDVPQLAEPDDPNVDY